MINSEYEKLGTFRTPVVSIHADHFYMENLTVENTAGFGPEIGQALAMYVSGDCMVFKNVRLLGNQDTLYSSRGRQYFFNCYIEGHVDFIFGSGTIIFDQCEVHSLRQGYITAASTPKELKYGFLFFDCRLTGSAEENTVFLGRPWRPYAHTFFVRTWMGPHIKQEGWDNWRNEENEKTVRYAEYGSTGPGASVDERVSWSSLLKEKEVEQLTIEKIFRVWNDWTPQSK
jgi:pectinesterase